MFIKPQYFRVHKMIKSATIIFYNIYSSVLLIKFKTRLKWMIYILTPLHDIEDTCNININFYFLDFPFSKQKEKGKNVTVFASPLRVLMLLVFRIWISPLQKHGYLSFVFPSCWYNPIGVLLFEGNQFNSLKRKKKQMSS